MKDSLTGVEEDGEEGVEVEGGEEGEEEMKTSNPGEHLCMPPTVACSKYHHSCTTTDRGTPNPLSAVV